MRYSLLKMCLLLVGCALFGGCVFDSRGLPGEQDGVTRIPDQGSKLQDQRFEVSVDTRPQNTTSLKELSAGEGRLWFGLSGEAPRLRLLSWRESTRSWFRESRLPSLRGDLQWASNLLLPGQEELAAIKSTDAAIEQLQLFTWGGAAWREEMVITTQPEVHAKARDFALARESSGEVLLVYRDEQWLQHRTYTGGQWSAGLPVSINASRFPEEFLADPIWVELISKPGADEITLVFADTTAHLTALVWDGDRFLADSAKLLEDALKTNPAAARVTNRPFDGAYESQTGEFLVAWGSDEKDGFYYQVRKGTDKWGKKKYVAVPAGRPDFVDLSSEPGSDRVAAAFLDLGNGNERLALGVWDGSDWVGAMEYEAIRDVNDTATGDFSGAVAWLGTLPRAVCVFADDSQGALNWYSWEEGNPEGKWLRGEPVTVPGMGEMESVTLSAMGQRGKLMAIFSDDQSMLYYAQYAAEGWSAPVNLTEDLSQIDAMPFSFAVMP